MATIPTVCPPRAEGLGQFVGDRALARPGRAGQTDRARPTAARIERAQHLATALVAALHPTQHPRQRTPVAREQTLLQLGEPTRQRRCGRGGHERSSSGTCARTYSAMFARVRAGSEHGGESRLAQRVRVLVGDDPAAQEERVVGVDPPLAAGRPPRAGTAPGAPPTAPTAPPRAHPPARRLRRSCPASGESRYRSLPSQHRAAPAQRSSPPGHAHQAPASPPGHGSVPRLSVSSLTLPQSENAHSSSLGLVPPFCITSLFET